MPEAALSAPRRSSKPWPGRRSRTRWPRRPGASRPALILTDADGAGQFADLQRRGVVDDATCLCVDVDDTPGTGALMRWLGLPR
jgi:hypothetical protein